MKTPLILLILSVSTALATISVRQIKEHTAAVRQSILMLENIGIMLQYRSLAVEEIFYNLALSSNYSFLPFIQEISKGLSIGEDYDKLYGEAVGDMSVTRHYDREDRSYMLGFLSMLGKSDVTGQLANCEAYKQFFKSKLSTLERDESSRCKSTAALIIGIGVMITVIII